jgi:hypothetical protein
MQTILKEIVLTNIVNVRGFFEDGYACYDLENCKWYAKYDLMKYSYDIRNFTFEIIKSCYYFAEHIKHMNKKDLKELIHNSCAIGWIKNATDELKMFALKDNIVNILYIKDPTKEMLDMIKDRPCFKINDDERIYIDYTSKDLTEDEYMKIQQYEYLR